VTPFTQEDYAALTLLYLLVFTFCSVGSCHGRPPSSVYRGSPPWARRVAGPTIVRDRPRLTDLSQRRLLSRASTADAGGTRSRPVLDQRDLGHVGHDDDQRDVRNRGDPGVRVERVETEGLEVLLVGGGRRARVPARGRRRKRSTVRGGCGTTVMSCRS
jgi:hypothetical protein